MSSYLMKSVLALVCLTLVSMPLSAQKGHGGGGGGSTTGSGCAIVDTPMLSTFTASAGINVGVFDRIGNCSSGKQRYTVTVSAMSSCGQDTVIASNLISFNGGESKLISIAFPIAPDTCLGATTVSVSVYAGGTLLGSQPTTLTIQ